MNSSLGTFKRGGTGVVVAPFAGVATAAMGETSKRPGVTTFATGM
jgi:hypothetical protein